MVIPSARNDIFQALVPYVGLVSSRRSDNELKKFLYKQCTEKHPIHDKLDSLSSKEIKTQFVLEIIYFFPSLSAVKCHKN